MTVKEIKCKMRSLLFKRDMLRKTNRYSEDDAREIDGELARLRREYLRGVAD